MSASGGNKKTRKGAFYAGACRLVEVKISKKRKKKRGCKRREKPRNLEREESWVRWVCMHGSGGGVVHAEREGGGACVCMCAACMHLLGVPLGCVNVYQYVCMCVLSVRESCVLCWVCGVCVLSLSKPCVCVVCLL
ncbi:unnamed protein product [Camellia sinensis]